MVTHSMHQGKVVLDVAGEERKGMQVTDDALLLS